MGAETLTKHAAAIDQTFNVLKATADVIAAAEWIEADLSGNADSRINGRGFMLVEEARVRLLLKAVRHLHATRTVKD